MIISRSLPLRMRNVTDRVCIENQNTFSVQQIFLIENPAIFKILWENIVQPCRPQMTTWRMLIACLMPKATNRHLEYVILIAFTL